MPWTAAQHRLFEAAAHNPVLAQRVGIPQNKAQNMAKEGIKYPSNQPSPQKLAQGLRQPFYK